MNWVLNQERLMEFPDFESSDSELLLNPKFSEYLKFEIRSRLARAPFLPAHFILTSSGSSGQPKILAVSKRALLTAAQRVNEYLQASSQDRWHCPLPLFHIGALAMGARAQLLGQAPPYILPFGEWSAERFVEELHAQHATLTSLVPTQMADLLSVGLRAPSRLRAVIVGGAALSIPHFQQAKALGWKLSPSYGSSETCAAIAFAKPLEQSGDEVFHYQALKGVQLSAEAEESPEAGEGVYRLRIQSDALFSHYLLGEGDQEVWTGGPEASSYLSADLVRFHSVGSFSFERRSDELIKVRGELINLKQLSEKISKFLAVELKQVVLNIGADGRLELNFYLPVPQIEMSSLDAIMARLNSHLESAEKISRMHLKDIVTLQDHGWKASKT